MEDENNAFWDENHALVIEEKCIFWDENYQFTDEKLALRWKYSFLRREIVSRSICDLRDENLHFLRCKFGLCYLRWKLHDLRRELLCWMESVDLWSKMKICTLKMRITLSEMKIRVCYLRWKFHGLRWELMCWMESVDLRSKMKIFPSKMTMEHSGIHILCNAIHKKRPKIYVFT